MCPALLRHDSCPGECLHASYGLSVDRLYEKTASQFRHASFANNSLPLRHACLEAFCTGNIDAALWMGQAKGDDGEHTSQQARHTVEPTAQAQHVIHYGISSALWGELRQQSHAWQAGT